MSYAGDPDAHRPMTRAERVGFVLTWLAAAWAVGGTVVGFTTT